MLIRIINSYYLIISYLFSLLSSLVIRHNILFTCDDITEKKSFFYIFYPFCTQLWKLKYFLFPLYGLWKVHCLVLYKLCLCTTFYCILILMCTQIFPVTHNTYNSDGSVVVIIWYVDQPQT